MYVQTDSFTLRKNSCKYLSSMLIADKNTFKNHEEVRLTPELYLNALEILSYTKTLQTKIKTILNSNINGIESITFRLKKEYTDIE